MVHWRFRRFVRRLLFRIVHDVAPMVDREQAGREASPSGVVLDSQTVKPLLPKSAAMMGSKKTVGCERHIAVDTDRRALIVNLTIAGVKQWLWGTTDPGRHL